MRNYFSMTTALVAAAMGVVSPSIARAHFVLESPPSWAVQDNLGAPQKSAPCGQADVETTAVATNEVTTYQAGDVITVTVNEAVYHPGHYRVVLSTSGRGGLPPDPMTTEPGTCRGLAIQDPPVFPVLADGVLQHTTAFEGPQSFSVTLPKDVTCTSCTLQVLEFMSAEFGSSPNCFYHHCADIAISAPRAGTGGADGGAPKANASGDEGSCALSGRALSTRGLAWPMSALLLALAVVKRRQSAR